MNLKLKYYLLLLAFTCTVNQVMAGGVCALLGYADNADAVCNGPTVIPNGACVAGTNIGFEATITGGCIDCSANGKYRDDFMIFTATGTSADITLNSTGILNADVALLTNSPGGCGDATSSCPVTGGLCLYACVTSVGAGSVTLSYTSLTIGGTYIIQIQSSDVDAGTFEICIVTPPPASPANAYGIYAEDGSSTTTDCQIYAQGGTGGGIGCLVCTPDPDAYAHVSVSAMSVITADNISCINTNITMSTAAASPDWTGSDAPLTGAGSPKTVQYTTTGRKNVVLLPAAPPFITTLYSEDFEGAASGWTGQETATPAATQNYWVMGTTTGGVKAGWLTLGAGSCGVNNTVLTGIYCPRVSYFALPSDWYCNYSAAAIATSNRRLYTPAFSTLGYTGTFTLTFNYVGDMNASDNVQLQYSTNGSTWTNITGELYNVLLGTKTLRTVTLPAGVANQATVYIGWNFNSTTTPTSAPPTFMIDDITVTESHPVSNIYTGFNNMQQSVPATGTVLGSTPVCPSIANNYASSVAGTPGFTYSWAATTGCGTCGSTITTPLLSSTDITFTNPTGVNQTFTVSLTITSQCCGALTPVTKVVTVYPQPANPAATASPASICTGGTSILSVTGPIAGFNYGWYTVPTGGTAFATGTSAIINPVLLGATTYYIDAVSNNGCPAAARGSVTVTGTNTPPVVPNPPSKCAPGIITATVSSPVPGATYNWYSDPGLTTLLQSSTSTSYNINVPGPGPNDVTVYVTVIVPGCGASTPDPTTASITASVPVAHWTGAVSTDWFTPGNWYDGCVPTCGTVVRIDNAVPPCSPGCGTVANECVINFDNGGIACASDIRIQSGRTLTLVGAKAVLEVTGNWKLCGAFTAGTGLVKFTGSAAQSIGGTVVATFYNLVIDKSASAVTMLLNANVSNQLNLTNGVLGLNSKTLTVTNGDTTAILRASGSVLSENEISRIQWNTNTGGSYVFPFGYSGTYIPFTFNKKGDATARNISVGTWNTPVTDNKGVGDVYLPSLTSLNADTGTWFFLDRWWAITPVPWVTDVDSAGVTFAFTAAELATINNPALDSPVTYHWNGSRWDEITATVSGNTITSTWKRFSGGGGGGKGGGKPLPIDLLYFNAKPNVNVVDLTWVTASEINNDYFTIEKTTNASDFDIVVKVPGAGTSTQILHYSEVDRNPYYGTSYYRLKQTDYDGKYEYSDLVAVKFLKKLNFSVRPNPATDYLEITFGEISKNVIFVMTPEYDASIKIYDALGEIVYEKKFNGTFYKFNIDISSFSQGMYFVSLTANNELYKAKFVKE